MGIAKPLPIKILPEHKNAARKRHLATILVARVYISISPCPPIDLAETRGFEPPIRVLAPMLP
jgi:hypothetical protein